MNDLQAIGTTADDNRLFLFPANGHLVYFEQIDYSTLRLHAVDTLEGVTQEFDESSSFEELPNAVRAALSRSNYRMRSTKTTLEGVMHGD